MKNRSQCEIKGKNKNVQHVLTTNIMTLYLPSPIKLAIIFLKMNYTCYDFYVSSDIGKNKHIFSFYMTNGQD